MVLHAISGKNASLHHCIIFHHKMMKIHHYITLHVVKYYILAVYLLIFICAWLHIDLIVSSQGNLSYLLDCTAYCWSGRIFIGIDKVYIKALEILLRAVILRDYLLTMFTVYLFVY